MRTHQENLQHGQKGLYNSQGSNGACVDSRRYMVQIKFRQIVHRSPISDTTILASTGADCKHIRHVETQLPYATLVAVMCGVGYLIAGILLSPWAALAAAVILLITVIFVLNRKQ